MWHKVYYEHYGDGTYEDYWEEKKVLPYMVRETNKEKREAFKEYLIEKGFECCGWNDSYPGILVNVEFKRFAMIHRPFSFSHKNNRDYTISQFKYEILK